MSKTVDFSYFEGFPFVQGVFKYMQESWQLPIEAIIKAFGNKVILHGVEDQGASYSDGWVIIDGKPMPFLSSAKAANIVVEEITDSEEFGDGTVRTVYFTKQAKCGNIGGYPLSEFRRFKTDALNVNDSDVLASAKSVKKLYDNLLSILSFESTIILKGCDVSNVNGGASTLDIGAGMVLLDNNIVSTAAYSGAYPVYIKPDGTFVNVQPAGSFIKFDPYTSQRYADVLKRATTSVGEIKTFKTLSDRFDAAGMGRWEMAGFKICDDLQSRTPVGYDRRAFDPGDNAWDESHKTVGFAAGEKKHTLTKEELPNVQIDVPVGKGDTSLGPEGSGKLTTGNTGNEPVDGPTLKTKALGSGTAMNNMQPYRIVVFAERI